MGEVVKLGPRSADGGAPAPPNPSERGRNTAAAGSLTLSAIPRRTLAIGGGVIAVLVAGGLIFAFTRGGGGGTADAAAPAVTSGAISPAAIDGGAATPAAAMPGTAGGYTAPDAGMIAGETQQAPSAPSAADSGLPPSHNMGSGDSTGASVTGVGGGGAYGSGGEPLPPGTPLSPSDPGWDARSGSDLPGRTH